MQKDMQLARRIRGTDDSGYPKVINLQSAVDVGIMIHNQLPNGTDPKIKE
jgi:hypothetical protein